MVFLTESSLIRPEATGYGCVYFVREMLATKGESMEGKRVAISGSGNVAQFAAEKVLDLGGIPVTFSDSSGYIYDPAGIDREKLAWVMDLKNERRGRIREYAYQFEGVEYHESKPEPSMNGLWSVDVDVALPCATQNELNGEEAAALVANGVMAVGEGANMLFALLKQSRLSRRRVFFSLQEKHPMLVVSQLLVLRCLRTL